MRFSRSLIPTLKEVPSEARVISHILMLRAGLIRPLTTGIYTWLPLGLRVLRKVEAIVRAEMNAAGAQEIFMPAVQPAELWMESGRWEFYGKELLRFQDRHDRMCCFGPTHEEVVTDLVRREIHSHRDLPVNFYQIQTKFRDEIRPRFGIMRGREFIMKDAYSFDLTDEGAEASYRIMFATYQRIFKRLGLRFSAVEADSGNIGGSFSHEFHVLAEAGEDIIASCNRCNYAANLEKATSQYPTPSQPNATPMAAMQKIATPQQRSIDEVASFLQLKPANIVKTLVIESDKGAFLLLLPGDRQANEIKIKNALHAQWIIFPDNQRVKELTGVAAGFLGPVAATLPIIADPKVLAIRPLTCGANDEGWHLTQVGWERDLPLPATIADLSMVMDDDPCPRCPDGQLHLAHGIEVGHVFKLGTKYSKSMGVTVLDEEGHERIVVMGCYGIGVSRIVAAAIEQHNDAAGIVWPAPIAPFHIELLLLNPNDPLSLQTAENIYQQLLDRHLEVLFDDRDERPGVKFKDADLLGIPWRVIVGGRALQKQMVEIKQRSSSSASEIAIIDCVDFLTKQCLESITS